MAIIIFNSYQYLYKIFINNKQKSPDKEFMKTSTQLEFSLLNSKWKMMQSSQCFPLQNTSQFPWTIIISPLFSGLLGNSRACKNTRRSRERSKQQMQVQTLETSPPSVWSRGRAWAASHSPWDWPDCFPVDSRDAPCFLFFVMGRK